MEENDKPLGKKNDSFSGTEFQTYNAWRWKYMSGRNEIGGPENRILSRCTKAENCVLIKDKYSSSETEKRKNELLYGEVGEPRQPLFPTVLPEIPQCNDLIFSNNNSFESDIKKKTEKLSLTLKNTEILEDDNNVLKAYLRKGFDNSNKLYDIISEQNKQIEILQQQIQQVLKLQNAKDNQIEQLLKSQESKENKIEKLLQSAEIKDEEIEKLLKLKQKQEQHLKELIILQEEKEAKNFELLKKLNLLTRKETCSIGTMTNMAQMVDCSTNTTEKYHFENGCRGREKPDENSCLRVTVI